MMEAEEHPVLRVVSNEETAERVVGWLLEEQVKITAYTKTVVGDWAAAEDVFQEVCVRAVRESHNLETQEHAVRWGMKVARNAALDRLRRRKVRAQVLSPEVLDLVAEEWEVDAEREQKQTAKLIQCMEQLTPRVRAILKLRYEDGLKSSGIADAMNQKVESIYKTITRAHAKLRQCMEQQG
jgi:RNA polymerase sigma-70 factor (ECF subfamily)